MTIVVRQGHKGSYVISVYFIQLQLDLFVFDLFTVSLPPHQSSSAQRKAIHICFTWKKKSRGGNQAYKASFQSKSEFGEEDKKLQVVLKTNYFLPQACT